MGVYPPSPTAGYDIMHIHMMTKCKGIWQRKDMTHMKFSSCTITWACSHSPNPWHTICQLTSPSAQGPAVLSPPLVSPLPRQEEIQAEKEGEGQLTKVSRCNTYKPWLQGDYLVHCWPHSVSYEMYSLLTHTIQHIMSTSMNTLYLLASQHVNWMVRIHSLHK